MNKVVISLTEDAALLLFEWLADFDDKRQAGLDVYPDEATKWVLWKVEGILEQILIRKILDPNYQELIRAAKSAVLEKGLENTEDTTA